LMCATVIATMHVVSRSMALVARSAVRKNFKAYSREAVAVAIV